MKEYADFFVDRTLRRTLTRLLGRVPTDFEIRERISEIVVAGESGACQEFALDGKPLFQHRLVREGLGMCSDVVLMV